MKPWHDDGVNQAIGWDLTLDEYYDLRGWDTDGLPKRETLNALGLGNLII